MSLMNHSAPSLGPVVSEKKSTIWAQTRAKHVFDKSRARREKIQIRQGRGSSSPIRKVQVSLT